MWPLAGFCGREGPGRPDSGELTRWQRGLAVGGDRGEQELLGKGFGWGRGVWEVGARRRRRMEEVAASRGDGGMTAPSNGGAAAPRGGGAGVKGNTS